MAGRKPDTPTIRCAIYTRKSTEEGLEQEFNSLDAQREAGEACIASQKSEGWVCLPDRYDDGGYTGGNMERPALKRLMADIDDGRVDCVVVYKVDRMSRSLLDFTHIMEALENRGVSFVSVTQQFNTTSSMGRLTLNILLSFAQFEREIISERTRDKIAAARRKGKWSGGRPILGFDVDPKGGRLLVNEAEAAQVRTIYEIYLDRESLIATIAELDARGWTNKQWTNKKGRESGGSPFNKHSLYSLLTNVLYTGRLTYKDEIHAGEQPSIVDDETFRRVRQILKRNGSTGGAQVRNQFGAILKGLINCVPCGCAMVPTHTTKQDRRYRYYVCAKAQKRGWHNCPSKSIPAGEIEKFVVDQVRGIGRDPALLAETLGAARAEAKARIKELEAEKSGLDRELRRHNAQMRALAGLAGAGGTATDRMADLLDRIRGVEQRLAVTREELAALGRELVDEKEAVRAMAAFDPVWETLTLREQARVLRLLVQRVDYDGDKGTVAVTFHPAGIETLSREMAEENA
ncbi:MAG TPA: recombinase family protein [Candidatus Krumholzibacteria bacterium]|nr:recombinase family protein [Candidatus Krumholzibacteria bacterium]HPD72864.1 recombinase family protein [Candidatus Krumholzibacteria bacterium]HRY42100.1 recombinase family protein [Candidatus Krumholzibacteria bacterium]